MPNWEKGVEWDLFFTRLWLDWEGHSQVKEAEERKQSQVIRMEGWRCDPFTRPHMESTNVTGGRMHLFSTFLVYKAQTSDGLMKTMNRMQHIQNLIQASIFIHYSIFLKHCKTSPCSPATSNLWTPRQKWKKRTELPTRRMHSYCWDDI